MNESITDLSNKFLAAVEMAKAAGLKGNARVQAANDLILKETGRNCLELLGMTLGNNSGPEQKGLEEVRAFVSACCLVGQCYFAPRSTIYSAYELYCVHSGITPQKEQYFAQLLRIVVPDIGHLYQRSGDSRKHCHTGICMRECMDPENGGKSK